NGITYVFLGRELGARTDDLSCYDQGKVQYERLAQTDLFSKGIARIRAGIQSYRIALMCAEKEPLDCHRTILIARHLETCGVAVHHILQNGQLERHCDAIARLAHQLNLGDSDMFLSPDELIRQAYKIQGNRIAYGLNDSSIKQVAG